MECTDKKAESSIQRYSVYGGVCSMTLRSVTISTMQDRRRDSIDMLSFMEMSAKRVFNCSTMTHFFFLLADVSVAF